MRVTVKTPPSANHLPLTLEAIKNYIRVTHSVEDDLIKIMARSAVGAASQYARISILPHTLVYSFEAPRAKGYGLGIEAALHDPDNVFNGIALTRGPVQQVAKIETVARNGVLSVVDPSLYTLRDDKIYWSENGWLVGESLGWVRIEADAGWPVADNVSTCPDDIKEALLLMIADSYENRDKSNRPIPAIAERRLARYWTSPLYRS